MFEKISKMLEDNPEDLSVIESLVEKHHEEYEGDLYEEVFREAVSLGATHYVSAHISDVDINDDEDDGHSTYLDETDDEEMLDILFSAGATRSFDSFDGFQFAAETVNGYILSFEPSFQEVVFEKYLEHQGISEEKLIEIMKEYDADDFDYEFPDDFEFITENDFEAMGVCLEDGKIDFKDMVDEDGFDTRELLEALGYELCFEGDSWKFESNGIYYIE